MAERPILFDRESVRGILDGRKTQTRRPATALVARGYVEAGASWLARESDDGTWAPAQSPFGDGADGDRLWVRETWARIEDADGTGRVEYRADTVPPAKHPGGWGDAAQDEIDEARFFGHLPTWRPSIHMPRWASRLTLRVKRVWVERLHDIGDADALAEGVIPTAEHGPSVGNTWNPTVAFRLRWGGIYGGASGWDANPLVWCCEFAVEAESGE